MSVCLQQKGLLMHYVRSSFSGDWVLRGSAFEPESRVQCIKCKETLQSSVKNIYNCKEYLQWKNRGIP